jgi:hypothetical protein
MQNREARIALDGAIAVYTPERNRVLPWTVIWAEPTQRGHWPTQQLSPQAVGTWSTLRRTTEHQEALPA